MRWPEVVIKLLDSIQIKIKQTLKLFKALLKIIYESQMVFNQG